MHDDDAGAVAVFGRGHGEFGAQVEDGNDRASQVDDAAHVRGHVGDRGDLAEANDLAHVEHG